jgi:myo-inositol-1(or 4)-monophosphatase
VPCDLLDIGIEAALRAGGELMSRFGRTPRGVQVKAGPADLVSDADRAAEAAVAQVISSRRPQDGLLAEEGTVDRDGSSGLRWVVDPLDGTSNFLAGIPLFCVSIACEDAVGTVAGVIFDPVRDELFAAVRGGPVQIDGALAPGLARTSLPAAVITGGIACATSIEAQRAGQLDRRLFQHVGQRRALGSAALELAWTAAGRFDACFHEQWLRPWDVDAGLFICQRAGLRVHRLPPLEDGLPPRLLVAREPLAAEILELVGPDRKERRRAAQRAPVGAAAVADAMRRRRR